MHNGYKHTIRSNIMYLCMDTILHVRQFFAELCTISMLTTKYYINA
jgi:hypothetical protein